MSWIKLALQTTTPMFSGGTDEGTGIRVPSLRGCMRYWFRALAAPTVGHDLRLLADLEREVFGATDQQSRILLRISDPPQPAPRESARYLAGNNGEHIRYILGQGIYKFPGKDAPAHAGLQRDFIAADTSLHVDIRFAPQTSDAVASLALASLWLLCTYGGLGSRVRKGFGGLRITGVKSGTLPGAWTAEDLVTPDLPYYENLDHLAAEHGPLAEHRTWLAALDAAPADLAERTAAWPAGRPSYPALGPHTLTALRPGTATWPALLATAGKEWRNFRASEDPDPPGPGRLVPHTPEYRDVIRGSGKHFPLGALGLPIQFYDPKSKFKALANVEDDGLSLRRASPVWFRVVGSAPSRRRLFTFALLGEFLPTGEDTAPFVSVNGRILDVSDKDIEDRATTWVEKMRTGGTFVRPTGGR
ncbi:type III-B CRISPR module RAMP protein Cmr1 [Streptomyces sp. NPDC003393]